MHTPTNLFAVAESDSWPELLGDDDEETILTYQVLMDTLNLHSVCSNVNAFFGMFASASFLCTECAHRSTFAGLPGRLAARASPVGPRDRY